MAETFETNQYGTKIWKKDGKLHREDGPAVIYDDGTERWYINGKAHRIGAPALTNPDGTEIWYHRGELHRDDGPAFIAEDAKKQIGWFYRNKKILSYKEFQKVSGHSDEYMMYLKLKWGE